MSWQQYVDKQLLATGSVTQAAICGIGGGVWAASPGFNVSAAEIAGLAKGFTDSGSVFGSGVHTNGQKYMTIKADPRSIYGKSSGGGVACVKTTQAILIGVYDENIQPGQCTAVVEKLADYLIDQGY